MTNASTKLAEADRELVAMVLSICACNFGYLISEVTRSLELSPTISLCARRAYRHAPMPSQQLADDEEIWRTKYAEAESLIRCGWDPIVEGWTL